MREASSLVLAARLLAEGAEVCAYDPVVDGAGERLHGVIMCASAEEAVSRRRRGGARDRVGVDRRPRLGGAAVRPCARPVLIDGRNALDPDAMARRRLHLRGHRAHPAREPPVMQAVILVGGAGTPPAAPHRHPPQADDAAGRPALRGAPARPAAPPRRDRRRSSPAATGPTPCGPTSATARRSGVRLRYVVDPEPLGTAGGDQERRGAARRRRRSWCSTGTSSPTSTSSAVAAPTARTGRGGHGRADAGRGPERLRPGAPARRRLGGGVRREARAARSCAPASPSASTPAPTCSSRPCSSGIPAGRACSIEREVFPALADGGRLFGFPSDAYWRDIGTPGLVPGRAPRRAERRGPHRVADRRRLPRPRGARSTRARAVGAAVERRAGRRASGAGAVVEGSVVGAGTRVGRGRRRARRDPGRGRDGRAAGDALAGRGGRRRRRDRRRRRGWTARSPCPPAPSARVPATPCSLAAVYGLDGPEALARRLASG